MSDDLLKQYTSALKHEYDGATASPEATRTRVIRSLAERRPRRAKWWAIGIPLLALFGGSTAWAAATGQLGVMFERATVALGISDEQSVPQPAPTKAKRSRSLAASTPVGLPPSTSEQNVDEAPVSPATPPPDANSSPHRAAPTVAVEAAVVANSEAERRRQEEAAAIAAYQQAHTAHFARGDCSSAVPAYAAYLARYPQGSFVMEAKYNRALCLVKTGRADEARAALSPFAAGGFGNYRKEQAQALLDALAASTGQSSTGQSSTGQSSTDESSTGE